MKRLIFIFLLLLLYFFTALFMVFENADFFNMLYPHNPKNLIDRALWAALLCELFAGLSFALKIENKKILNFGLGAVGVSFFLLLIVGGSLKVLQPYLNTQSKILKTNKILQLIEKQQKEGQKRMLHLKDQKTNIAMQAIEDRKLNQIALKTLQQSPTNHWLNNIAALWVIMLRVLLQTSNLFCSFILGLVWRNKKTTKNLKNKEQFVSLSNGEHVCLSTVNKVLSQR